MVRKIYLDPVRINFNVARELKESAAKALEETGFDMTGSFTLALQKVVDEKSRLSPRNEHAVNALQGESATVVEFIRL